MRIRCELLAPAVTLVLEFQTSLLALRFQTFPADNTEQQDSKRLLKILAEPGVDDEIRARRCVEADVDEEQHCERYLAARAEHQAENEDGVGHAEHEQRDGDHRQQLGALPVHLRRLLRCCLRTTDFAQFSFVLSCNFTDLYVEYHDDDVECVKVDDNHYHHNEGRVELVDHTALVVLPVRNKRGNHGKDAKGDAVRPDDGYGYAQAPFARERVVVQRRRDVQVAIIRSLKRIHHT